MRYPVAPFWPPASLDRRGLLHLLSHSAAWAELMGLISAQVSETVELSELRPTEHADDGLLGAVYQVPWKLPAGSPAKPPVLLATVVADRVWDMPMFTANLRRVLRELWTVKAGEPPAVLMPILYIGREAWRFVLNTTELRTELPPELAAADPKVRVMFVALRFADPKVLANAGPVGRALRAWALDSAPARQFVPVFESALEALEKLPVAAADAPSERLRRSLLWFLIHVMAYRREVSEFPRLRQSLLGAFVDGGRRRDTEEMMRSIFDSCTEIGEIKARREVLLDLMTTKFGPVPDEDAQQVNRQSDVNVLNRLLRGVLTARHLDDVGLWDAPGQRD